MVLGEHEIVAGESQRALGRRPRCGDDFDMGPGAEKIFCELERGHSTKFHRNRAAGFEWHGREPWPMPRPTTEVA